MSSDPHEQPDQLAPSSPQFVELHGRRWQFAGRVGDFEEHGLTLVQVDGRAAVIARLGSHYRAFWNRCPHQGGPLCRGELSGTLVPSGVGEFRYGMDGEIVRCPWHNWQWNLHTGMAVGRTTRRRLTTRDVIEIDGALYVALSGARETTSSAAE